MPREPEEIAIITEQNPACYRMFTRVLLFALVAFAAPAFAQKIVVAPVPASHIIYDPVSKKIFACIGSRGKGTLANSITRIDPETGRVEKSVFIGSEPSQLALSEKSKYLYVLLSDRHSIRRMDLDTMTPGMQFPVGEGVSARLIMPMPGNPEGVMAIRYDPNTSPSFDKLTLFVNGKVQPLTAPCGNRYSYGIDPARIFSYQSNISSWDFTTYQVSPEGFQNLGNTGSLLSGNVDLVGQINGLIVTDGGNIIDPEARERIGTLPDAGGGIIIATDPDRGMVYQILGEKNQQKLRTYDIRTFSKVDEMPLQDLGVPVGGSQIVRWGAKGLAYISEDAIYFLQLNLGPKLAPVDLSVKRSTLSLPLPRKQQVKYILTVTNNSAMKANGVFVTDALPEGVEVLDVKTSQGNGLMSGGIVRADLGALAGGAKATVSVTLMINEPKGSGFAAVVRGQEPDPVTENNMALLLMAGHPANVADLACEWNGIRQVSEGAGADLRATLIGRIVVKNQGKLSSKPCLVRFYLSGEPGLEIEVSQLLQEVSIPALRPGETYTVSLEATLRRGDDATGLYVYGVVDPTNQVDEAEKGNNAAGARIP